MTSLTPGTTPLPEESLVVAHHQLAVDLLHGLEGHADRDQDRGAAEGELRHLPEGEGDRRQQGDDGEEERAGQRDAVEDLSQTRLGGMSGANTGDESALLADGVVLLLRVDLARRVEVGEEDDEDSVEADV